MPQDYVLARLLANNVQWAEEVERDNPGFFKRSADERQQPKVLYIGCSDSRVPESVVTMSMPGDIFVHRNIANQFRLDDDSALAVLTFAVANLGVSHIIVAGHTGCGGVQAALDTAHPPDCFEPPSDPLPHWLAPLTQIAREYPGDLPALTEANVRAQVENIARTDVVKAAWAAVNANPDENVDLQVHGWMYELETGLMRDLGISRGKADAECEPA
ncbi:carbonic anhydrase [Trametes versicolor FP-101664 SS1]|uniref:carbonic anhydrase n=1 Tax=Trametes versicolor (strain FP-101664) TaxID=717944 RepID=UPI0004623E5F|nr:carbonic anhydrase [Trametes versicolor FP-101664 SS1]EIW56302.1 carbonic anhydrase [Trametes versicolor FP-101664 SS1]